MSIQLFVLRGVPDDEAYEIRALLEEHNIDYYETPGGNWGISLPALWLKDESQLERAKALLGEYQAQRAAKAQQEYSEKSERGERATLLSRFLQQPLLYIVYTALIIVVLYFSVSPFINFGE